MTLNEIKNLVNLGIAENFNEGNRLDIEPYDVIAVSHGVNGMSGALLHSKKTGKLYGITARNSTLFECV